MKTAFHGLGQCLATFETDSAASDRGKVCKMAGGGKIAVAATAGEGFCGVISDVRGGAAAVQLRGYVEVAYTGTAPSCGWAILAADGAGGVKTAESGHEFLVVNVDSEAGTVGLWL